MLRGIRNASNTWLGRLLMGGVMTLLAGIFALWGINDIFRGFGQDHFGSIYLENRRARPRWQEMRFSIRLGSTSIPRKQAPAMVAARGCAPPIPPIPPETTSFPVSEPSKCRIAAAENVSNVP